MCEREPLWLTENPKRKKVKGVQRDARECSANCRYELSTQHRVLVDAGFRIEHIDGLHKLQVQTERGKQDRPG